MAYILTETATCEVLIKIMKSHHLPDTKHLGFVFGVDLVGKFLDRLMGSWQSQKSLNN